MQPGTMLFQTRTEPQLPSALSPSTQRPDQSYTCHGYLRRNCQNRPISSSLLLLLQRWNALRRQWSVSQSSAWTRALLPRAKQRRFLSSHSLFVHHAVGGASHCSRQHAAQLCTLATISAALSSHTPTELSCASELSSRAAACSAPPCSTVWSLSSLRALLYQCSSAWFLHSHLEHCF